MQLLAISSWDSFSSFWQQNETATLAFMIYSHSVFVMLRVVTFILSGSIEELILRQMRSLIYSADTVATIMIYFVPKLSAGKDIKKNLETWGPLSRSNVAHLKSHPSKESSSDADPNKHDLSILLDIANDSAISAHMSDVSERSDGHPLTVTTFGPEQCRRKSWNT